MECEREGYYGLSHNTVFTPFFAFCVVGISNHSGKMEKLHIADIQLFIFLEL